MANSEQLRQNKKQHKPKNVKSKKDDTKVSEAMKSVITYLKDSFDLDALGYSIEYTKSMTLEELVDIIKKSGDRESFSSFNSGKPFIKPDGGFLILKKDDDKAFQKLILIAEMKHQGTNDERLKEGKKKQAQGNAIERLGKNLTGIRAVLKYEPITPFVCFGWGVDFAEGSSILDRVLTMNEFYPLNKIFVNKQDKGFSPVSMYFRKKIWESDEIFEIMKEIAETSIRRYIY